MKLTGALTRPIFLTGKGGVGRTAVAAAFARARAVVIPWTSKEFQA